MAESAVQTSTHGGVEDVLLREEKRVAWGEAVVNWRQYLSDKADKSLVFVGDGARNDGEILTAPYSHRFRQEYTKMQYAKIQDFIRGALSEYDDPHLAILTFSTTTTTPSGELRPPLDHLDELLEPWMGEERCPLAIQDRDHRVGDCPNCYTERVRCDDAGTWGHSVEECSDCSERKVRCEVCQHTVEDCPNCCEGVYDELVRSLDGLDFEYLSILEPTTDDGMVPGGYAHQHVGVVIDGEVTEASFQSVISRHLRLCDGARGEAHEMDDTIEVKRAEDLNNPGAYLFKYLGKSWDTEEMEDYEERFASLLFESGRQRFRASNGAQRWMQPDEDNSGMDWMFVGVGDDERVAELAEYDDAEELRIEKEMGVGSFLDRREPPDAVDLDDSEHKIEEGRCVRCGVPERAIITNKAPWDGPAAECPGGRDTAS